MSFRYISGPLPTIARILGLNDYGLGNGVATSFPLTFNTFSELGNEAQSGDALFFTKLAGTLTGSGSTANTSSAPANLDTIIFPNANNGVLKAYDDSAYGRVASALYFVGDLINIDTVKYTAAPGDPGIKCLFTNRITEVDVALPSWYQFAPLDAVTMAVGTYQAAGTPLYLTGDIVGADSMNGSHIIGDTSITLHDASTFQTGQFVRIGTNPNYDYCWVTNITGNVLTLLQALTFNQANNAPVFACAAGMSIKLTVPSGATSGNPRDFFNVSLDANFQAVTR